MSTQAREVVRIMGVIKEAADAFAFAESRRAKGVSVSEAARRLNVSTDFVSEVESGDRPIPEGWMRELSEMRANR